MVTKNTKLYKYHSENLKALDGALLYSSIATKQAIRNQQSSQTIMFTRMYFLLLGAWAEVRLLKLLHESGGFPVSIRRNTMSKDKLYEKWQEALSSAFEHKYECTINKLPKTPKLRFDEISKYMAKYLQPVIIVRNRLAHGQLIYPLNNELTKISEETKAIYETENILLLQHKKRLLNEIANTIHDLVVSKPTFERDFDNHFKKIEYIERDLSTRSYKKYTIALLKRHNDGKIKKNKS